MSTKQNKKPSTLFHIGKGIKANDDYKTPIKGEPNSNLDTYYINTGKLHRRRKFGSDGTAVKDYDIADKHKPQDLVHDFNGTKRQKKDRQPTKKERREIKKAKKKRKFWKGGNKND